MEGDETSATTADTTNLLSNCGLNSAAPLVILTANGEILQLRKKRPDFSIEDGVSMMRETSTAATLSSYNDPPVICTEDADAIGSLIALLSALYALVLIIFSLTIELSTVLQAKRYVKNPWLYEFFHIYLYSGALAFFCYCYGFMLNRGWIRDMRSRETSLRTRFSKRNLREVQEQGEQTPTKCPENRRRSLTRISHSGPTAGSLYLRLGCIVFGIVGIVSIGMQLFECIENDYSDAAEWSSKCGSLRIIKLCLGTIFTFMQMHFIFQNSKITVHRSKNVARFGTMHLVAVNLWVWVRTLIIEEYEVSREIDHAQHENAHAMFKPHRPINASETMLGITSAPSIDSHVHKLHRRAMSGKDEVLHLVLGCSNPETCFMRQTFAPMMSTCIIEYSLIAACVMFVLWRNIGLPALAEHKSRKQNLRVDCSSSTNGLFLGLVFLVATFVSMIVFYSKLRANRDADALWVFSLTHTALYLAAISACILGFYRLNKLSYDTERHATGAKLLEDILLIVGLIGQLLFCISGIVGLSSATGRAVVPGALYAVLTAHVVRLLQVLLQTVFILSSSRMIAKTSKVQHSKPGREVITFLMVVNMALFLVNTFEGQKASVNRSLVEFYGQEAWAFVVQSTMPLSIFYRFHSSVCLAEIWKHSYRVHIRSV